MKGDTNIYFKYLTLFEKKNFTEKNKVFVKVIHILFLKNIIIFRIILLHLNNHIHALCPKWSDTLLKSCSKCRNIWDVIS